MVMSALIVVKGQLTYVGEVVEVFRWNEMLNGRAVMSVSGKFCCSVWIVAFGGMYPAVARAGWMAFAHKSQI